MNCFFHNDKPAVVACAKCGIGLCRNCMNDTAYTYDSKPLCINCSIPIAQQELIQAQSNRVWSFVKFIFSGLFIGIGLMAFYSGADIMNVWIISGVAGIPTAFKATRRTREQRIMDEIEDRYKKDLIDLLMGWVLRLIIKLAILILLAPICAAYTCISNLVIFLTSSKKIREARNALNYLEQGFYEESNSYVEQLPQIEKPVASYAPKQTDHSAYAPPPSDHSAYVPKPSDHSAYAPSESYTPMQQATPSYTDTLPPQSAQTFESDPSVSSYKASAPTKQNSGKIIGFAVAALVVIGLVVGYFVWYTPYAKDRDALRTYVLANNLFLRSSKIAGVEYNILQKIPYGSELITYAKDSEWAEVKINGVTGFVASSHLLDWNDFKLLNNVWGSTDAREYIESSKCRFAILDYCKRNQLNTGNDAWQLYTLQKNVKPNNVLFPRLNNRYNKFTEFAFIIKNNITQERRFTIYSFDEETEKPIFLYEEDAPKEGQIKSVIYTDRNKAYKVNYSGLY